MLIINADDFGLDRINTDQVARCFQRGLISSTTAMVFMIDSERAAQLAIDLDMDPVGLHLNLSYLFNSPNVPAVLLEHHRRVVGYLNSGRPAKYLYHPGLKNSFEYCFKTQWDEFIRLFKRNPTHVDGHQYFHLCANIQLSGIIPANSKLRPNINEGLNPNPFKKLYKLIFNHLVSKRFITVDRLFDVDPHRDQALELVRHGLLKSKKMNVELMVHIEDQTELNFMFSPEYKKLIEETSLSSYADLPGR